MVVGEIVRHSGNAEAARGIGYIGMHDVYDGQKGRIRRKINGFKLEEGIFVVNSNPEQPTPNTLVFRPKTRHRDGRTMPWVVVHADEISDGKIRVRALPEEAGANSRGQTFVPVSSEFQESYADQLQVGILRVIHNAGSTEGLLANIVPIERDLDLSLAA